MTTGPNLPEKRVDYGFGEPVGTAVRAGETAGEACAGEVAGEDPGDDCGCAGAGELCDAGWFFISSRRNALLAVL